MNTQPNNPLTDPKLWIAVIAILIALFNLGHMLWFRGDQNKKWKAINEAYLNITDIFWIGWLEIDAEKAKKLDWGYNPYLISHLEGRVHKNNMWLYDKLVLWDIKSDSKIEDGGSSLTVSECRKKADDLNLADSDFSIRKHKQLHFDIENVGNTVAKIVKVEVFVLLTDSSDPKEIFSSISKIELPRGERAGINIDFFIPIEHIWEDPIIFTMNLDYLNIENEKMKKESVIIYSPSNDTWSFGA